MSKVKRSKLEMETVFQDVEEHMIRLRHEGRVKATLMKRYNVSGSTVGKWMREVLARLRVKETAIDREDRRNMMRATLDTLASMAINKSIVLRNPDGRPVLDANTQKPIMIAAPQLKEALNACAQIRQMDALDNAVIKVDSNVNGQTKTTLVIDDSTRTLLEKGLLGLA